MTRKQYVYLLQSDLREQRKAKWIGLLAFALFVVGAYVEHF